MKCINFEELKPAMLMVLVQTVFSIVNICYKLAANDGMNLSILVGYRFLFGAAFIAPLAFFAERKKRPKLTKKVVFYGFLCGLFGGSLGQNLYVKGLVLTSATFASAMTNLIPAITFTVAVGLRLEKLGWNTAAGKAKVLGTVVGIGGAMIITFYKGKELDLWDTHINLLQTTATHHHPSGFLPQTKHGGHKYILGAVSTFASCVCYSLWLITQAKAAELYPCPYSFTAIMALAASVQGIAFALTVDDNWNQWNMGWDIRLFTVAFSGIFASGLMFTVVAWCVRARGPLFVSIFQPLMLVMVGLMGSLFLEEKLHLGMVIGAIFIVTGLYVVLWGKGKENKVPEATTTNIENGEQREVPPPPVQNSNGLNNNERQTEEEVVARAEEETHIDIPPPPPPLPPSPQSVNSYSNRGNMTEEEAKAEAETHIHILALQSSSKGTNIKEGEGEGEAYEEMPPSKNDSSPNNSGGKAGEEVDAKIDEKSRTGCGGVEEKIETDSQNGNDDRCSENRVDSHLSPSLQKQSNNIQSGRRNEIEVDAYIDLPLSLQSDSGDKIKEVDVEVSKQGKEKKD